MTLSIAIVGRPNVGKSTLFNRLVGKRLALVADQPGLTRDRREGEARIGTLRFRVIDTAGLEDAVPETMEARMLDQTEKAVLEADLVLFLIDARAGITPLDRYFARWLRRHPKPVVLLANKCEGAAGKGGLYEAYELGFEEPVAISAEHGEGLHDLSDRLLELEQARFAPDLEPDEDGDKPLQLAIVGRPNVGKSTLVNQLLGQERMLTGPEAGVTRDSISVNWSWRGNKIRLFDTAGLRRKAKAREHVDWLSAGDALRAIRFAQTVVVVLDGEIALEKQDRHIISLVAEEGRALIIAVNKWDLIEDREAALKYIREEVLHALPQVRGISVAPLSAITGKGTDKLMEAVFKTYGHWNQRVSTSALNNWLRDVTERHPPPLARGRRIKLRYATQVKARPPTFVIFCSQPSELPEAYRRYLINEMRDAFDFPGIPVKILLRKGRNPYVK
ncbi:MAG: ribosome biogenesis GTPase Der [Sphingomonadales bacterium]